MILSIQFFIVFANVIDFNESVSQWISPDVRPLSGENFKILVFQFHVEKEPDGWTEPILHPVFSQNGALALVRLPVKDGDNGNFMHACQVQANNVIPLTHGAFELTRILTWDEDNHLM